MADLKRITEILNGRSEYKPPAFLLQWQNIYYRMSIHTTGVCPAFYPLRWDNNRGYYIDNVLSYPTFWLNAIYDRIFDDYLLNRHPRESNEIREYRKSVYRPYQQAALQQAIDKVKASIFAENKYTLVVESKDDNDYIWGRNFDGKTLVDYVAYHFKSIVEDPNSLFVVLPREAGYKTSTQKVEPYIKHIPSRNIIYWTPTEIIFREDVWAWYINENAYIRYRKNDKGEFEQFDGRKGYYAHLLGYAPCRFAGGVWNTHGYFDSYLKPAQAFCDDFVAAHSAVQLVNKEAAHPFIIAASRDCPECDGRGQYQYCGTHNCRTDSGGCDCVSQESFSVQSCGSCRGSGQQSYNPSEWLIVPPNDMGNDLIKIINPDVKINEFLAKYADNLYDAIMASLHQSYIDEAQSGTAKKIDREGEYLFYQTISDGVWALIDVLLNDILSLRNTSKYEGQIKAEPPKYILVKPTQFDLKTERDLLEEFKVATESKIPDYIRGRQAEAYVDKLYGGDDLMVKKATIINYMDAYSVMTPADKAVMISSGVATAREIQFSAMLPNLINKVAREMGKDAFLKADYEVIEEMVKDEFAEVPPPPASQKIEEKVVI